MCTLCVLIWHCLPEKFQVRWVSFQTCVSQQFVVRIWFFSSTSTIWTICRWKISFAKALKLEDFKPLYTSDWSRFLSSSLLNLVQRNAELNSERKTRVLNRTHRLLVVRQQVSGLTLAELFLLQVNVGIKSMLDSLIRYIRGVEIISGQFR